MHIYHMHAWYYTLFALSHCAVLDEGHPEIFNSEVMRNHVTSDPSQCLMGLDGRCA